MDNKTIRKVMAAVLMALAVTIAVMDFHFTGLLVAALAWIVACVEDFRFWSNDEEANEEEEL